MQRDGNLGVGHNKTPPCAQLPFGVFGAGAGHARLCFADMDHPPLISAQQIGNLAVYGVRFRKAAVFFKRVRCVSIDMGHVDAFCLLKLVCERAEQTLVLFRGRAAFPASAVKRVSPASVVLVYDYHAPLGQSRARARRPREPGLL